MSEWSSLEDYEAWEARDDHRAATMPLRACFAEASRPARFAVELEDAH